MPALAFSVAQQVVHILLEKDNQDGPAVDISFDVLDADTSKARLIVAGKDGAPDIVLTFARGGMLESTDYRDQPEDDAGAANERRNARDIERIKEAKEAVAKFEEQRHDHPDDRDAQEPDEHTKALAAMDLPPEPPEGAEGPQAEPVRSPRADGVLDGPARPDEGRTEDDPRRGLPPGDTGNADRPSGLEPKDGDVITTTRGPRTR